MFTLVDRGEGLWLECERLASDPSFQQSLLGGDGQPPQLLLAYAPVARRNQFQAMLYGQARHHGCRLLPLLHTELLGRIPWVGPVVCHFHWLHGGTAKAADEAAAEKAVEDFAAILRRIRIAGHRIVWTVHNVMPHETRWPDHDRRIHQMVADAADVIHVMTAQSQALCAPYYTWDAGKELRVAHPSYVGAHADWLDRTQARAEWRIAEDEVVFLSFGAVLGYKGHAALMSAFDAARAATSRRLRLLVAGAPADESLARSLRLWAHGRSDVTLDLRTIASDEIQYFFRAADVAVCPYERTLNSGAALMATSFGLPVIGPRVGGFVDNIGEAAALLYDPRDAQGLTDALVQAVRTDMSAHRTAAAEISRSLAPASISNEFFAGLRSRLGLGDAAPAAYRS